MDRAAIFSSLFDALPPYDASHPDLACIARYAEDAGVPLVHSCPPAASLPVVPYNPEYLLLPLPFVPAGGGDGVNPVVRDRASVYAVSVSVSGLLCSAVCGAAAAGRVDLVQGCIGQGGYGNNQECARQLMREMMAQGVPLLLALQCGDRAKSLHAACDSGSPVLLCDKRSSVFGLVLPMGRVAEVAPGGRGVLPAGLRDQTGTVAEVWVRVACVAPWPRFSVGRWFRGDDDAFRWDLIRDKPTINAATICPATSLAVDLFRKLDNLETLGACLGDYKGKLRALDRLPGAAPAPLGPRGRPPVRHAAKQAEYARQVQAHRQALAELPMWTEWMRAVLLERVLAEDDFGIAHAALAGALPAGMLREDRAWGVPPAPVSLSDGLADVGEGEVRGLLALIHQTRGRDDLTPEKRKRKRRCASVDPSIPCPHIPM